MVRDAYRFLLPALGLCILFAVMRVYSVALFFLVMALFAGFFFRNPRRRIPDEENLIVSPADGKIVKIARLESGDQLISIFLSIFDVHVNRCPISGKLKRLEYKRGKFKAAFDEEASRVNEQNILTVAGQGIEVTFKQIAGLIARRVVCWKQVGNTMERGELIGLIRFGSRVDVQVPEHVHLKIKVGDKVLGGSSVLGDYK